MNDLARQRPESFFSDRFNVTAPLMERLLGSALRGRVEDADIYLEYRINEELVLEESAVKKASRHVSQGAGVRAQAGVRTGYAHTDDISIGNLEEAARQARAIADQSSTSAVLAIPGGRPHNLYDLGESPTVTDLARKLALLRSVDAAARAADPRVKQVIASIASEEVVMLIATASGWTVGDVRPLTRLNVSVIAEDGRQARDRDVRRGRPRGLRLLPRGRALAALRRRGGPPGDPQAHRGRCAGGQHDRRARTRMARHPAARGHRTRAGRGLQPQGNLGVRRPPRSEGRLRAGDRRRRRDDPQPARFAQRRRRGDADGAHGAHRARRAHRLSARSSERAPHGDGAHGQRTARVLRAPPDAAG